MNFLSSTLIVSDDEKSTQKILNCKIFDFKISALLELGNQSTLG